MPQLAGETILASDVVVPKVIVKAATQSVTSSTTLVNDSDFAVTLTPGKWRVELRAHTAGVSTGAGDIKMQWAFSGTNNNSTRIVLGPSAGMTDPTAATMQSTARSLSTSVVYGNIDSPVAGVWEDLYLDVAATGVLQLQWAQNASSSTATTMSSNSLLFITQLDPS
jgi:hypothetical protein